MNPISVRIALATLLLGLMAPAQQLSGTVVNAVTGAPVRKAVVEVAGYHPPSGENSRVAFRTGADGRFDTQILRPGHYLLSVRAAGYLESNPANRDPIELVAGSAKPGLVLKLMPYAVITGRILDPDGDPLPGAAVAAIPVGSNNRELGEVAPVEMANDAGEYRISRLRPGTYLLVASHAAQPGAPFATPSPLIIVSTYFPSETEPTTATALRLAPGAELRGQDIRLRSRPSFRVRGRLHPSIPGDRLSPQPTLSRLGVTGAPQWIRGGGYGARLYPDRTFEFSDVTPGEYILWAGYNLPKPDGGITPYHTRIRVTVRDGDINGLELLGQPAVEIKGRIVPEGPSSPQLASPYRFNGLTVALHGKDPYDRTPTRGGQANVAADGTFTLSDLAPGEYLLAFYRFGAQALYIRSATQGGRDVLATGLDTARAGELVIRVGGDGGLLKGRVMLPETPLPARPSVLLWPDGPARTQAHRVQVGNVAPDGSFELAGIAPGAYRVAALIVQGNPIVDAKMLESLEPKAALIEVATNSQQTKDLTFIE